VSETSTPAPHDAPDGHGGSTADEPVLPDAAREDLDEGWGDDPRDSRRDDEWYQRERPPHHEG
jgi:hypothetical protein